MGNVAMKRAAGCSMALFLASRRALPHLHPASLPGVLEYYRVKGIKKAMARHSLH